HTLPTLNRTSLWISEWISDLKTHCIRGKHIALRFCLGDQALSLCPYREIVPETVQPGNFGLSAKPGELAFGVVAVTLAGFSNGLLQCEAACKILRRLAVSERGQRWRMAVAGNQVLSLFNQAFREHGARPGID